MNAGKAMPIFSQKFFGSDRVLEIVSLATDFPKPTARFTVPVLETRNVFGKEPFLSQKPNPMN